jgi:hypothetical protein
MPTLAEVLKQTGFTDEQIAQLDPKMVTAVSGALTAAEQQAQAAQQAQAEATRLTQAAEEQKKQAELSAQQAAAAREAAEVAQRSNAKFYDETIAPALNGWGTEKANLEAQAAFYRAQNEAARSAGFVPAEAPNFQPQNASAANPTRDAQGRYVAGAANGTPGSPTFQGVDLAAIDQRLGTGISNIGWAMQEYARFHPGQFLPDSFDKLGQEADNARLPFRDYVARKYDFAGKQQAAQKAAQDAHDAEVKARADAEWQPKLQALEADKAKAIEDTNRKWAEKIGSNPEVRIAQSSKFTEVARAVKSGERPDPLALNDQQRRAATAQAIRTDMAEQTAA